MTERMWRDESLRAGRKSLRTLPGALLLGPTGARLWADYVEPKPGFVGRFDFIHKLNIPLLFEVTSHLTEILEPCRSEWFPSRLCVDYEDGRIAFSEQKFITWDDCAVSCQTWTNKSGEELVLRLRTDPRAGMGRRDGWMYGEFPIEHYSFDVAVAIAASDPALFGEEGVRVAPGSTRELIVVAACGIRGIDGPETLAGRAAGYAAGGRSVSETAAAQRREYERWFERAPGFDCSDELLNRTWRYRWFLLRHNLADPRYGRLKYPLFYEGRSHKKGKAPFSKGGWEFSKLIPLSVPLHVTDARWYHDPSYCEGAFRNMAENADEYGQFCSVMVDSLLHSYANFSCWAAYRLFLVHRDAGAMSELLPALKRQIGAWETLYGNERDHLMIEYKHSRTGKEYQPSYWYFHQYPKNPKDPETYTPLKRVDRSVYHYLNALGVARLCRELGDPDADAFFALAERIKADVLDKMWDEASQFFYDLHYQTDEKAMVKNIVGFYPAWARMVDGRHDGLIEHLFRKEEFDTGCPFPSVAADCPAYAKEGGWMGHFIKGRNGCVWNGPTWPYTNSIALDALALESRRLGHRYDRAFGRYLREYSFLHFRHRDLSQPGLVEHYNSQTGEPLSDEQEYNHSYYIDLIVSHVAGLAVESDRLVLDPLDIGLDYFRLERVRVAGSELTITYRRPTASGVPEDVEPGYRLYAGGRLVFAGDRLQRADIPLRDIR